jgi:hypothetical protein
MTITAINLNDVREEICHKFRNSDIFTTTIRGVTTVTENSTATAGQTAITPAHSNLKNVRSLTIDAAAKYFINDFTINFETGVITLLSALTGGEAIALQYDYGTDKIYPDMARDNLTLESYPRIGIKVLSMSSESLGLGGLAHISDITITIYVWMPANKTSTIAGGLGGNNDLELYLKTARSVLLNNAKGFYSFPFICARSTGPIMPSTNNKIIQISQDFSARFVVEH